MRTLSTASLTSPPPRDRAHPRSLLPLLRYLARADDYLLAPLQLGRALDMLLASVLFKFHSTRMVDLVVKEARKVGFPPRSSLVPDVSSSADLILGAARTTFGAEPTTALFVHRLHAPPPVWAGLAGIVPGPHPMEEVAAGAHASALGRLRGRESTTEVT